MIMKKVYFLFLMAALMVSCQNQPGNVPDKAPDIPQINAENNEPVPEKTSAWDMNNGRTFLVIEKKVSASLSDILIIGVGFKNSTDTIVFEGQDPLENIFVADLNGDKAQELYLITRSVGSGSYANILGVATYNGNSYGSIYTQEMREEDVADDGLFAGYMGHDSVFLQKPYIIREYPQYLDGDNNANPSGSKQVVSYVLTEGEAGYVLKPLIE